MKSKKMTGTTAQQDCTYEPANLFPQWDPTGARDIILQGSPEFVI